MIFLPFRPVQLIHVVQDIESDPAQWPFLGAVPAVFRSWRYWVPPVYHYGCAEPSVRHNSQNSVHTHIFYRSHTIHNFYSFCSFLSRILTPHSTEHTCLHIHSHYFYHSIFLTSKSCWESGLVRQQVPLYTEILLRIWFSQATSTLSHPWTSHKSLLRIWFSQATGCVLLLLRHQNYVEHHCDKLWKTVINCDQLW